MFVRFDTLRVPGTLQWVAATTCSTSDCKGSGVGLYNAGQAIDTGAYANLAFQRGSANGEIYWDQIHVGVDVSTIQTSVNGTGFGGDSGFTVGYQALVAADTVKDEDLSGGGFSGVLGLSPPANSVITTIIPGATSGGPDGATFLDNLFGAGNTAPVGRYLSLALERWGDSTTKSSLGFGARDTSICGNPCQPNYSNVVSSPSGPLFWRIMLEGITVDTFNSPSSSTSGPTNIQHFPIKMPSSTTTSQSWPVAVMDSGGGPILFADRNLLNAVYGVYGIGPSSDGYYYVPCKKPIAVSFIFNSIAYPVHPLDMSDFTSSDQTHQTCLGSMQYGAGLTAGDIILGSSFLKNVYSVYTYPITGATSKTWAPLVGLVPLTNSTTAAQQFYNVRSLNMPLSDGSTSGGSNSGSNSGGGGPSSQQAQDQGRHVVSGGIIALCVVLGFVALAAGMFCAWFFWLRRKYGKDGSAPDVQPDEPEEKNDDPAVVAARGRRSKKYQSMQRQKSMVDGYSDLDVDSWACDESIGDVSSLAANPLRTITSGESVRDEKEPNYNATQVDSGHSNTESTRENNIRYSTSAAWESTYPPAGWSPSILTSRTASYHRDKSPSVSSTKTLLYNGPNEIGMNSPGLDGPYPTSTALNHLQLYSPPTRHSLLRNPSISTPVDIESPDHIDDERGNKVSSNGGYFDSMPMKTIRVVQNDTDVNTSPTRSFRPSARLIDASEDR